MDSTPCFYLIIFFNDTLEGAEYGNLYFEETKDARWLFLTLLHLELVNKEILENNRVLCNRTLPLIDCPPFLGKFRS